MDWNPGKSLLFLTVIVDKTLIFTSNFLEKETLNWKSLDKSFSRFMQFHLLKKFNFAFKKFNFVPLKFNSFIREIQFSYKIPMYEVLMRIWGTYTYEVLLRCLWGIYEIPMRYLWGTFELIMRCLWNTLEVLLKYLLAVVDFLKSCFSSIKLVSYKFLGIST